MVYNKITNPETGRKVTINSRLGKNIIKNYLYMIGSGKNPHTQKEWSSYSCHLGTQGINNEIITIDNCEKQISGDQTISRCKLNKYNECRKRQSSSRLRAKKNWDKVEGKMSQFVDNRPTRKLTHKIDYPTSDDLIHDIENRDNMYLSALSRKQAPKPKKKKKDIAQLETMKQDFDRISKTLSKQKARDDWKKAKKVTKTALPTTRFSDMGKLRKERREFYQNRSGSVKESKVKLDAKALPIIATSGKPKKTGRKKRQIDF
uniref:Uncharacterized protein n=1 Tax=viral metagenome TaxID=1070528 RepID=A0A6C0IXK4_9ZZZZ